MNDRSYIMAYKYFSIILHKEMKKTTYKIFRYISNICISYKIYHLIADVSFHKFNIYYFSFIYKSVLF